MKTLLIVFLVATCIAGQAQEKEIKSAEEQVEKSKELPQPLFVIDGVKKVISQEPGEKKQDLDAALNISPSDIESISVLKGQDAIDKYGEEGKNGVILITTKSYILKGRQKQNP